MRDDNNFPQANVFKPERFLEENGSFISQRPPGFLTFSTGRRNCFGEKLALANLFLTLVRFLQATSEYEIVLENGAGSSKLEINPDTADTFLPVKHKIIFEPKK
jgi:cytochrome P450